MLCFKDTEQYQLRFITPESAVYQRTVNLLHGSVCYSIDVEDPSGMITFGCSDNIILFSSCCFQYKNHTSFGNNVPSVARCTKRNEVYYVYAKRVECMPVGCFAPRYQLKKFSSYNSNQRIAVNDRYVAVANAEGYRLHLYYLSSKTWQPYFAGVDKEWLRSLKFHPDGDLITLNNDSWLRKYRISDTESPELIWESQPTGNKAYALCVEQNTGLVYVTGSNHTLYIISAGMFVIT